MGGQSRSIQNIQMEMSSKKGELRNLMKSFKKIKGDLSEVSGKESVE